MNKKNNPYVLACFVVAAVMCVALMYFFIQPAFLAYDEESKGKVSTEKELKKLSERAEKEKQRRAEEELNLKSIKQIYESGVSGETDGLSAFGTMFDDIIKLAQQNNLFIRSIEYDTKPADSTIYTDFNDQYNVCKLKFFFVGKYPNLRTFLNDITNNFKYLISVSDLNITAFANDTDYILIKMSLTLYSKKPTEE